MKWIAAAVVYFLMLGDVVRLAYAMDSVSPRLDLWDAPWRNMAFAIVSSMVGGLWAFLRRVAKDEIPTRKMAINLAADMLAAVLVGVGVLFLGEAQRWTYASTMLALIGGGIASPLIIEIWRQKGSGLGKGQGPNN